MEIARLISLFAALGILLLCSAFFSSSETALSALTRAQIKRIKREKRRGSRAIVHFLDDPRRLFITVLFGNTLVNMAFVSIVGAIIYDDIFKGRNLGFAYVVAIFAETAVLLFFGEITPKTIAIRNSEKISRWIAAPLWAFSRIIFPFRRALRFVTDIFLPFFGVSSMIDTQPITSDEIRAVIEATSKDGAIDKKEGEVLSNIFELQDTKIKEVMVPRTKIVGVSLSATLQEAFQIAMQEGYSRLPVYRENLDGICGIFYAKDLSRWITLDDQKIDLAHLGDMTLDDFMTARKNKNELNAKQRNSLIRPPFFVFMTRDIGSLLKEMTQKKEQMAILLDEYGGVAGLATLEDIIEEIVGEIEDEYDRALEQKILPEKGRHHSFFVPGALSLRSLNRQLKLKLDIASADTVGGYVTRLAGKIPEEGDVFPDESHQAVFEVLKMAGTRIDRLRVRYPDKKRKGSVKSMLLFLSLFSFFGMSLSPSIPSNAGGAQNGIAILVFSFFLVFSLIMMGFFAGSETAFVSASMARIEVLSQQSNRRALYIRELMQEPERMLGTVLVGTNLMGTAAGVAGLQLARYTFPGNRHIQGLANTLVLTFVILLFCEIIPKTIFRAKADVLAIRSAPALRFFESILRPFVVIFNKMSDFVVRRAGEEDGDERRRIMREEIELLAEMGLEGGTFKETQLRMVHGILDLETRTAGKIMTPLIDIIAYPKNMSVSNFLNKTAETEFSRFPIYEDRIDKIIGVVNVLDVLSADSVPKTIQPFIRKEIRHEPESRLIFPLLRDLAQSRNPMIFIVDEYGGVVGLVTIEDIVEEITGDIWDEKDSGHMETIDRISDDVLDCDGKTEIHVLNHDLELSIPEGEYNTIAGFIIGKLQRIPKRGESLVVGKLKLLVLDADLKSIRRVRIIRREEKKEKYL